MELSNLICRSDSSHCMVFFCCSSSLPFFLIFSSSASFNGSWPRNKCSSWPITSHKCSLALNFFVTASRRFRTSLNSNSMALGSVKSLLRSSPLNLSSSSSLHCNMSRALPSWSHRAATLASLASLAFFMAAMASFSSPWALQRSSRFLAAKIRSRSNAPDSCFRNRASSALTWAKDASVSINSWCQCSTCLNKEASWSALMAGEAGEGEDAPLMNGSEDTVVMSQLHGESAKEEHTGRALDLRRKDLQISSNFHQVSIISMVYKRHLALGVFHANASWYPGITSYTNATCRRRKRKSFWSCFTWKRGVFFKTRFGKQPLPNLHSNILQQSPTVASNSFRIMCLALYWSPDFRVTTPPGKLLSSIASKSGKSINNKAKYAQCIECKLYSSLQHANSMDGSADVSAERPGIGNSRGPNQLTSKHYQRCVQI